ncbi:MAG: hypothetical protein HQL16_07995 [Candidatus Omnitrophica bacterium]|nr:hypothetical protein [Candidatus Omnitrophota bacterium]
MKNAELLNEDLVKKEIERHRWIESEKAGADIGYEKAANDWLDKFSDAWMKYHMKSLKAPKRPAGRVGKK